MRLSLLVPFGSMVFLAFAYADLIAENKGLRKRLILARNPILIFRNSLRLFMLSPVFQKM
jgi:hypothetical protein